MIAIKLQCDCGQRYAFDVESANGRMPSAVACPVCGADGTTAANAFIAQTLGLTTPAVPVAAPVIALAPPPQAAEGGLRLNVPAPTPNPPAAPPPIPVAAARPTAARPLPQRPVQSKETRGKDGWATEETSFNKLGTYITVLPPILGTMLPWGIMGVEIPVAIMCIVVGACGLIGGAINIAGRGPMVAGAVIGLLIGLGGYGAVAWWIHDRTSVRKYEMLIAFAIGAAPGMLMQYVLQQILKKRASRGE